MDHYEQAIQALEEDRADVALVHALLAVGAVLRQGEQHSTQEVVRALGRVTGAIGEQTSEIIHAL